MYFENIPVIPYEGPESTNPLAFKFYDADKIVAELSMPQKQYYKEIVKTFGEDILLDNGEINKPKLANIIFTNTPKRETLNSLTYKYVVEEIKKR